MEPITFGEELVGVKELFDVSIRLNEPIKIGNREFEINETILHFDTAEIAQVRQNQSVKTAKGGFGNRQLIEWRMDTEGAFAITHGTLS